MRSLHVAAAAFALFAVACSAAPGLDAPLGASRSNEGSSGAADEGREAPKAPLPGSSSGGPSSGGSSSGGSSSGGAPAPDGFALVPTCTKTMCEFYEASDKKRCDDCLTECSNATMFGGFLCDPYKVCQSHCAPTSCSEASKKNCYAYSYKAKFPAADAAIEAECTRMANASITCGDQALTPADVTPFCHRNAQLEKNAMVTHYACFADASCGADASSCAPPQGTLGAEIGKKVASCGYVWGADVEAYIDSATHWLRPDVVAAGRGCITQSTCENAIACVNAFIDALDYTKN